MIASLKILYWAAIVGGFGMGVLVIFQLLTFLGILGQNRILKNDLKRAEEAINDTK
jgi:hypothetical protein